MNSNDHPSPDTLAAYVMDHLEPAEATAVEQHALECESCATALSSEARLEVASSELARHLNGRVGETRELPAELNSAPLKWLPLGGVVVAAAAAAGVVMWQRAVEAPRVHPEALAPSASGSGSAMAGASVPAPLSEPRLLASAAASSPPPAATRSAPPHRRIAPPEIRFKSARCQSLIPGLKTALAIPTDRGEIKLILSNTEASCDNWADGRFSKGCDVWRTRIDLPVESQKVGNYPIEKSFAYLDRRVNSGATGAWNSTPYCAEAGSSVRGTIQIKAIEDDQIIGAFCHTGLIDSKLASPIDGVFVAKRCPECFAVGKACTSNSECCTGDCMKGTCGL